MAVGNGGDEAGRASLVERADELTELRSAAAGFPRGPGRALKVVGPAGIGKTAVIDAFLADRPPGTLVRVGAGVRPGPPLSVARDLAEGVLATVESDRVDAVLTGAAHRGWLALERDEGPDAVYGLTWLVANTADEHPLLVVIEDVHAADEPSRRLIESLAHRAQDLDLLLVVTERTGEGPGLTGFEELVLRELSEQGVHQLAAIELGAAIPREAVALLHARTHGNPLRATRLVHDLGRAAGDGAPITPDLVADLGEPAGPGDRLLDPMARAVAEATAVIGGPADGADVAALCGQDPPDVLEGASRAGLGIEPNGLRFAHPLDETEMYQSINGEGRRALHIAMARRLVRLGRPDRLAADHLSRAGPISHPEDVALLRTAAVTAREAGTPTRSTALLRAIDPTGIEPSARFAHLLELGASEAAAGDPHAVDTLAQAAREAEDDEDRLTATIRQARAAFQSGDTDGALAALGDAVGWVPDRLRPRAVVARARLARFVLPERAAAMRALDEVVAAGWTFAPGDPDEQAMLAEIAFEHAATVQYGRDDAAELAVRALDHGSLLAAETSDGLGWWWAAYALHLAGDNRTSRSVLDAAVHDAQARGSLTGYVQSMALRSGPAFHLGDLEEAAADAELAIAAGRRSHRAFLPATRGSLAQLRIWMGDLDGAQAILAEQEADGEAGTGSDMLHRYGRALHHLVRDRPDHAVKELELAGEAQRVGGGDNPAQLPWRSLMAEALHAQGHTVDALTLAQEELALAERFGAEGPIGIAQRAVALAGPEVDRVDRLRLAVDLHERGERRVEHVQALISLGEALHAAGPVADARRVLREAMGLAHHVDARLLTHIARQALVAAGGRPRRTATRGLDAVTPAERRVLRLACEGRTNREVAEELFITQKAVEWHLTSAYRKLGVSGRDEAREALGDAG